MQSSGGGCPSSSSHAQNNGLGPASLSSSCKLEEMKSSPILLSRTTSLLGFDGESKHSPELKYVSLFPFFSILPLPLPASLSLNSDEKV